MFPYFPIKYDSPSPGIKKPEYSGSDYFDFHFHKKHHHHHHKHPEESHQDNQEFGKHSSEDYAKILGEGQAAENYVKNTDNESIPDKNNSLNMQSSNRAKQVHTGKTGIPGCGTASGLDYPRAVGGTTAAHGSTVGHGASTAYGATANGPAGVVGSNMNSKNVPRGAQDTTDPSFGPESRNIPGAGRIGEGNDFSTTGIHDYSKGHKGEFIGARMNERNVPPGSEDTTDAKFGPQSRNIPGAGRMGEGRDNLNGTGIHDYSKGSKNEFIGARMNERNAPISAERNMDPGFAPQTMNTVPGAGRMKNPQQGNVLLNNPSQHHGKSYNADSNGRRISVGSFEDKHDGEHAFEEVPSDHMHHNHLADMPHQQKYNYARAETVPRSEQKEDTKNTQRKDSIVKKVEKTLHIGSE